MEYSETCTRFYSLELVKAWAKAESDFGLKNSLFISDKGKVTQYIDSEEGELFHQNLKKKMTTSYFDNVCEEFFKALENKNFVKIFKGLLIFHEIDEYPEIANQDILRRLLRVRTSTESDIYKYVKKNESYIYYQNKTYKLL